MTCNTFPSEAYDLDGAETFEKVYPTVKGFSKSATAAIGICSSIGDLLLDALFIIAMDLEGYKEVSGRPAMPATDTSFQVPYFCLLGSLDP